MARMFLQQVEAINEFGIDCGCNMLTSGPGTEDAPLKFDKFASSMTMRTSVKLRMQACHACLIRPKP